MTMRTIILFVAMLALASGCRTAPSTATVKEAADDVVVPDTASCKQWPIIGTCSAESQDLSVRIVQQPGHLSDFAVCLYAVSYGAIAIYPHDVRAAHGGFDPYEHSSADFTDGSGGIQVDGLQNSVGTLMLDGEQTPLVQCHQ